MSQENTFVDNSLHESRETDDVKLVKKLAHQRKEFEKDNSLKKFRMIQKLESAIKKHPSIKIIKTKEEKRLARGVSIVFWVCLLLASLIFIYFVFNCYIQ